MRMSSCQARKGACGTKPDDKNARLMPGRFAVEKKSRRAATCSYLVMPGLSGIP